MGGVCVPRPCVMYGLTYAGSGAGGSAPKMDQTCAAWTEFGLGMGLGSYTTTTCSHWHLVYGPDPLELLVLDHHYV